MNRQNSGRPERLAPLKDRSCDGKARERSAKLTRQHEHARDSER